MTDFETWATPILGDNPTWRESGSGELARQAYQAGRDSMKADAERYRWLRNDSYDSEIGVWECRDMENRRIVLAGEELDDSVDAAIQGAKND